MGSYKHKTGVTLVEMVIVIAVIALLVAMVVGIASRISNQGKEQLTRNTFALLNAALDQFRDYEYQYKDNPVYTPEERIFYIGLDFPLDCNDYPRVDLEITLMNALGAAIVSINSGTHNPVYSGSEVLYFFLSRVPECRKTLDEIDSSLITNTNDDGDNIRISIDGRVYPLLRIVDPWGTTLRYDYYNEWETNFIIRNEGKRTFPVITSAGPDRNFNTTADNITSR